MEPVPNENLFYETLHDLIHVIMRHSMRHLMHFARENNTSIAQINLLFRLRHKGECSISELRDELNISNAAVSQLLDKLVQQELVERTEDPLDRRNKRIALTQKGEELIVESFQARRGWLQSLTKEFTPEEQDQLIQAMQLLLQKFSSQVENENIFAERMGRCPRNRGNNV